MYKILGIENVDYVSKKTGNRVTGLRLHTVDGHEFDNTKGNRVLSVFVSTNIVNVSDIAVGDDVEIYYNRFGGVDEVRRA